VGVGRFGNLKSTVEISHGHHTLADPDQIFVTGTGVMSRTSYESEDNGCNTPIETASQHVVHGPVKVIMPPAGHATGNRRRCETPAGTGKSLVLKGTEITS
jgi:hypothetical protein